MRLENASFGKKHVFLIITLDVGHFDFYSEIHLVTERDQKICGAGFHLVMETKKFRG